MLRGFLDTLKLRLVTTDLSGDEFLKYILGDARWCGSEIEC